MSDKHSNNDNEILEGEVNVDDINNIKEEKSVSETEVWNKEEAIKEGLSEQLGRAGKRVKANLNRIKEELGVDKLNTALAELIEFYEKRPVENNGIDIKQDLVALNKGKEIIENIINSVNSKTALFESEVLGKTREVQSQIDLSIKSFVEIMEEINSKFEEKIKEQEYISSSLKVELQEANETITIQENANKELARDKVFLEQDKESLRADLISAKNELNSLYSIKEEHEKLSKDLSNASEKIRELEHKEKLNESSLDILEKENKQLKEDKSALDKEVKDLEKEKLAMELSHYKELLDKEKEVKDHMEKEKDEELHKLKEKYEEEIRNLMREKFELEMKVESLSKNSK